jgi:hypothetical protein
MACATNSQSSTSVQSSTENGCKCTNPASKPYDISTIGGGDGVEWIEEMVSEALSVLPDSLPQDRPLVRLAVLAKAVDSGLFKKECQKQLNDAIHTELGQYITSGSILSFRKRTEEMRHHAERIGELALLSALPEEEVEQMIDAKWQEKLGVSGGSKVVSREEAKALMEKGWDFVNWWDESKTEAIMRPAKAPR